jgi:ubiquinone biosynthesis protein COQ4
MARQRARAARAHTDFAPLRALRAARTLVNDPDDLPQVFTIIESLSFDTLERIGGRMAKDPVGRSMLESRPDIVAKLADRDALAALPEGSFGRAYLSFVDREGISADGILAASKAGMTAANPMPAPIDWVHARMRDTHDLWHVATGYHGDVLGETALLGFTFAQTYNPAIGLILVIGLLKTLGHPHARQTILDGFRRGRRSAWLPGQAWESLLALPVDEVRRRLSLDAPAVYTPIRSAELKARAA